MKASRKTVVSAVSGALFIGLVFVRFGGAAATGSTEGIWLAKASDSTEMEITIRDAVVAKVSKWVGFACPAGFGAANVVFSGSGKGTDRAFTFQGSGMTSSCGKAELKLTGTFKTSSEASGTGVFQLPQASSQKAENFTWTAKRKQ